MFKHRMFSAFAPMTAQVAEGGEGAAPTAVKIRPNLGGYQTAKSASGSSTKICGDDVSTALLGATLDEAYVFVSGVVGVSVEDLKAKYGARNLGQQRMFLGNLIRGGMASKDTEKASHISAAFGESLPKFRVAIDARIEADSRAKADAKAKVVQEKADKKAEEAKAKAAKKAEDDAKKAEAKAEKEASKKAEAPKEPKQPA